MAPARSQGKIPQENGSRKRVWLPGDQFEECALATKNEAALCLKSSKSLGVLFTSSSKNRESLRPLSSLLGESVNAVSRRLRAFRASVGDAAEREGAAASAAAAAMTGETQPGRPVKRGAASPTPSAQSFTSASSETPPKRGRTRAASGSVASVSSASSAAAADEASSGEGGARRTRAAAAAVVAGSDAEAGAGGRRTRSTSHSVSPAPSAASGGSAAAAGAGTDAPAAGVIRTRRRTTHSPAPSGAEPVPTGQPTLTPALVVTRSSRVVRPSRRFLEDNALAPVAPSPAHTASSSSVVASSEAPRPPRPVRAPCPSSPDQELDEGVIQNVAEYADSMAAAAAGASRSAAPPPAVHPPSDIEAMLRAQWDGRLKGRSGREEEPAPATGRHLLRQPRLHLNNRVLKRLRDGRDLTYLSETQDAPAEVAEEDADVAANQGHTSGGGYVTCGPCGARRYVAVPSLCYKFGSWVCLHCIKFILKTLKEAASALKCRDDKDACRVHREEDDETPLVAPEQRCDACWLKACINALNFSEERHNRLRSSLPRGHQSDVPLFCRKRRHETGACEYGPLKTSAAPVAAASPIAAPAVACTEKAWGAAPAPGFEALSRSSPAKDAPEEPPDPPPPPEPEAESVRPNGDCPQPDPSAPAAAAADGLAARPSRTTRLNLPKQAPAHTRKAVTVIPLGGGWKRREFVRKGGRLDRVVYAPDGCRFKSVVELQAYLRSTDIKRRAKTFFTDAGPPEAAAPVKTESAATPSKQTTAAAAPPVLRDSFVKRGPRVKLVCRSASLVLGQPRAMFSEASPSPPQPAREEASAQAESADAAEPPEGKENRAGAGSEAAPKTADTWTVVRRHGGVPGRLKKRRHPGPEEKTSSRNVLMKLKVLHKYKHLQQSRGKERIRKSRCGVCPGCKAKNCTKCVFCKDMIKYGGPGKLKKSCIRRVCNRPLLPGVTPLKLLPGAGEATSAPCSAAATPTAAESAPAPTTTTPACKPAAAAPAASPLVRLDPWTLCEPAELWQQGVAVLAAEPPGVPVLCFVCASAGPEEMLYCNSCCEPFHPFCLEEVDVPRSALHQENWVCRRCQVCAVCGAAPPDDVLQRCHQCNQTYHLSCLGPHACGPPGRPDQPWTCVRCTRCRSCQKAEIQQYVGNLPLCRYCFQLHQRGNYCPLCGGCYEDDDFDTKMMECESCHTWVHAHCEDLSEEMYQILSFLPESVSYLCDRCQPAPAQYERHPSGSSSPEKRRPAVADICWRRAVRDEFESGCAAVIRAVWACLSRRPQAAALVEEQDGDQVVPAAETEPAGGEDRAAVRLRQLRNQVRRGDVASVRAFHRLVQSVVGGPASDPETAQKAAAAYQAAMADAFPWFEYDGRVVTPVKKGVSHPDHPYAAGASAATTNTAAAAAAAAAAQMASPTEVRQRASPSKFPRTPLKRLSAAANLGNHQQFRSLIDLCNRHYQSLRAREAGRLADARRCGLCLRAGEPAAAGRLLWTGAGQWLHSGCLLHSDEVFEEVDGSLRAVRAALHRGRLTRCTVCLERGATVGCGRRDCARSVHLPCAAEAGWTFGALATCPEHSEPDAGTEPDPVRRRVLVEPEQLLRRPVEAPLSAATAIIGSLTVHSFGDRVVPCAQHLLPVGMMCSRVYWSTINPRRRTVYTMRTVSAGPPAAADLHCVVDHCGSQAEVSRAQQQLEEWRRAAAVRARPVELGCRSVARFTFDGAPEPVTEARETSGATASDEDHEQQVRACLDALLTSVCRSVVEEEETLLAEANLNIPILENVDNDFLTLMLNELCEGDGATYLGETGGPGGGSASAEDGSAGDSGGQQAEGQQDGGLGSVCGSAAHSLPPVCSSSEHDLAGSVVETGLADACRAAESAMTTACSGPEQCLPAPDDDTVHGMTLQRQSEHSLAGVADAMMSEALARGGDAAAEDARSETERVAEIAESLEQLSQGSAEVSSSQLGMSPPQQPQVPATYPDWPSHQQAGAVRARHRSVAGYPSPEAAAAAGLLHDYTPLGGGLLGSPHASAFRPAARRPRSVSAEQTSYDELLERLNVKPVATVVPEPRGDHLWPPDLRTYSAQVHCRRRPAVAAAAAAQAQMLYQQLYQPWCAPAAPGWPAQDAWPPQKTDTLGWRSELPPPPPSRSAKERAEAEASTARQLWQLDGAGDSESEAEQGHLPSKCPKCRRMYRTRESMLKHQGQCDFEVDSSGSSEAEEEVVEWPVAATTGAAAAAVVQQPRRPFVEPGEALCEPPPLPAPPPPPSQPPPQPPPVQATGEAEVSSTTAPEQETPKLEIKQEAEEPGASTSTVRGSPSRPRRRSPKKRSGPSGSPYVVSTPASAPQPPATGSVSVQQLPQFVMIGNQLVSTGQLQLVPQQLPQPGVVIVQGSVSYTVVPQQQEPVLYGQPAPYILNYPQIALPPGANLQHLGSFELGGGTSAQVPPPQPFMYSAPLQTPGIVAPMVAPPQPPAAVPSATAPGLCGSRPPTVQQTQPTTPQVPVPVPVVPVPVTAAAAAAAPVEAEVSAAAAPPPPPAPPLPPPPPPPPLPSVSASSSSPSSSAAAAGGRRSPVQSCQVDSSRPQGADSPGVVASPSPEPSPQESAGEPAAPASASAPSSSQQQLRKVAKVKPRPTYSYRDAMKTNPMLQQEKGKLMRRLVPVEVGSCSGAGAGVAPAPAPPAAPAGADPAVSSSGADDAQKLSYRIKLRRDRSDDGFQVREIVRNPPGQPVAAGPALKSVKITARVGALGGDVLVVPRQQQRSGAEVEVSGDRSGEEDAESDKENRALPVSSEDPAADTAATDPPVVYEVTSADGFKFRSPDISEVWRLVFEAVQEARTGMKMKPLTYNPRSVSGLQMLGLTHDAVQFLLEQMPGAEDCGKHKFRFHKPEFGPLRENKFGCARAEGFRQRKPSDMFSWLASKHRQRPEPSSVAQPAPPTKTSRRGNSLELPMAMRYRQLCENARDLVGVYRSSISGRGLFCKRPLDTGEMVIEYAGQVIRSSLTDIREKYYSSRGIGCYMFKIDDDSVVDATMMGNAARFINHSCNPNCYSRVVDILGKKHIIIFALRRIARGEELTYDYKFPIEEDKIACTCGARRCRKYLN